ncbi:MAG: rRNA maturation RNase YbeY [Proteobacteria bacterium]|nr:MAG: rRNA maturation RNase YbeY [Pseudomonadota bacterium]
MTLRICGPPRSKPLPRFDRALLARRARGLLRALGESRSELSLALVDDAEMASLNQAHRGKSGPTDVLSFSLLEGPHAGFRSRLLGDVVIDVEQAARQARRARRTLDDEMAKLLIHGVLHLLGRDHEIDAEARAMRAEERRLWRALVA